MQFQQLTEPITKNLRHRCVPMLVGEPGIGKSSWIRDFVVNMLHTACFILSVNQLADKADMTGCRLTPIYGPVLDAAGQPVLDGNGQPQMQIVNYEQRFFPHTVIRQAIDYANEHPDETPVLFLDEINRTTPDVTSEALSIPTDRSIGDVKLPDNLRVIIAGNDKGNVVALDTASVSRFILYRTEPDVPTFLAANPGINGYIMNVLKKDTSLIYCRPVKIAAAAAASGQNNNNSNDDDGDFDSIISELDDDAGMEQFTTPRTITALSNYLNDCTYDELIRMMNTPGNGQNLLEEIVVAHTGHTPFSMALLAEIANTQNMNGQGQQTALIKPACFDSCRTAPSVDVLNQIITGLDVMTKSKLLTFCLFDRNDNSAIIQALVPTMNQIQPEDMTTLMQLAGNHQIDNGNLDAVYATNSPIASVFHTLGL